MSGRSRSFDDETEQQPDPLIAARHMRLAPEIRWTDARGARSMRIGACAVVGSSATVDLFVDDRETSRLHAELEVLSDGLWIKDLGSRNGTYVEGVRVTGARVPDGGKIRVGGVTLEARYGDAPKEVELWPHESFGGLVGKSPAMREMFARLARLAALDSTVLILGDTGSGKELVARALHESSARRAGPFAVVDCAAIPESLIEAELFGYAKGAFTGADSARAGAIEAAHGGTVFLDEIGELPISMQPKLLRAIESSMVRRIGETEHRKIDVRFLSATHRNLRRMVNEGAFREDLYFRLAVLPVHVPALKDRLDDLPALIEHFLPRDHDRALFHPELLRRLRARPWLGNVRELRNFVDRALAFGPEAALTMSIEDGAGPLSAAPRAADLSHLTLREARERWMAELEREYVRGLLERCGGNVTRAAEAAGVDRSYLHRLIKRHGL